MTLLAWQRAGGGGPAVVLVHPWAGHGGGWETAGWTDALAAAGFDVLVPDLPGHGASADVRIPERATYGPWTADALRSDLDRLGVGPVGVAAYDDACPIAGHIAVRAPDRVLRAVFVGCDDRVGHLGDAEAAAGLRDAEARVWQPDAADLLRRARSDRRHDPVGLAQWLEGVGWPAAARLGALRTPVLLANGTKDTHRERVPRLAALFHDARLVTVPGDGSRVLAAPALIEAVTDFFGGLRGARSGATSVVRRPGR